MGAHLDILDGPGINDNGSGSGTILEIAEQMAKVKSRNQVRFIWFSAEESGLIGSRFYVNSLSQEERDRIAAGFNIPAGGLFTGAEGLKTVEQVGLYGGTAGAQYDPCYHQPCDTIANINDTALDQMSDAAAHAVSRSRRHRDRQRQARQGQLQARAVQRGRRAGRSVTAA